MMSEQLRQTNVRLQDILNRLTRIESRLTRFGEFVGADMRLKFAGKPRNPRTEPLVVQNPDVDTDGTLEDVLEYIAEAVTTIETTVCRTMNYHGCAPQADPERKMAALRHYERVNS